VLENISRDRTGGEKKTTTSGLIQRMESFEFVLILSMLDQWCFVLDTSSMFVGCARGINGHARRSSVQESVLQERLLFA
jgi:hypothetical protein